jgi:hypothetical protein
MEPLRPIRPMSPLPILQHWWSDGLGEASASGAQDGIRYAFFPDKNLLLIERDGKLERFDTGEHRIDGVSQVSRGRTLVFRSQHGPVSLNNLKQL